MKLPFFGKEEDKFVYPKHKVVVVGIFERAGGGTQVRFGVGEYVEEEIQGRKMESFKVKWEDGREDSFQVPSFKDVYLRKDGGSVVFYYVQAPGSAIPLTSPTDAIKRLRFQSKEEAEATIAKLKDFNPSLNINYKFDKASNQYVVEYPVVTFDIDRDIPLRESYSKTVLRLMLRYLKRTFWEKWGPAIVSVGSTLLLLAAFLIGTGFISNMLEESAKISEKFVATMEKVASSMSSIAVELNETSSYLGTLVESGVLKTPATAPGPPPG